MAPTASIAQDNGRMSVVANGSLSSIIDAP